ncbi:MAG: phosphodiesterase [Hyphomicrobiales bacterium]|nr:phosphodiesterase [Hyphomicrobiales bacterium]
MLIAQITDTHIKPDGRLAYRKVDTVAGLGACVEHLNALAPRPDVVLMSGDLADRGMPEEYAVARPILDRLAMPVYAIPGNHDARDAFRRAFADLGYLPESGFLHYTVEAHPVRLIGLDTVVPGEAHGEVCAERLDWLDARLGEAPDRVTLIFMHHPPFLTGIRHMDEMNCRNGAALAEVVARHDQVQMILCGHVHRPVETSWSGATALIGPSPCHAVALDLGRESPPAFLLEPPACRLVQLTGESRLVSHISYIGAYDGPHPFFEDDGVLID